MKLRRVFLFYSRGNGNKNKNKLEHIEFSFFAWQMKPTQWVSEYIYTKYINLSNYLILLIFEALTMLNNQKSNIPIQKGREEIDTSPNKDYK